MGRTLMALVGIIPLVAGCATMHRNVQSGPHAVIEAPVGVAATGWQGVASADDQQRIEGLGAQWMRALAAVPRGLAAKKEAEKALVDPDAALDAPALSPGSYHCRLIRFGGRAGFAAFSPDFCYVEAHGDRLAFTKQTGSNLPGGWLYPDGDKRQVFLGTFRQATSGAVAGYGGDAKTDIAGVIERVAPFRWRLTLTRAGKGALLDVYELVPIPPEVPGAPKAVAVKS